METQTISLARQMQAYSKEERRAVMAKAAEVLADYYRTDPEILEWQALETEGLYDIEDEN